MTLASQRVVNLDEESLLGGVGRPKARRNYAVVAVILLLIVGFFVVNHERRPRLHKGSKEQTPLRQDVSSPGTGAPVRLKNPRKGGKIDRKKLLADAKDDAAPASGRK